MLIQLRFVSFSSLVTLSAVLNLLQSVPTYGQTVDATDHQSRYENLQQRITELEVRLGYNDPALIEELTSAADSAAALNLISETSVLLDRAIQIQRQNYGLFTAEQIPLYFDLMKNDSMAGNWTAVNTSLDYVYWLVREKQRDDEQALIANLIQLSELHLFGVAGDSMEEQAGHYRKAQELTFLALKLSENIWGRSDSRRLDLYYSLIKQFYLQSAAVERGGDTSYALRAIVPGSTYVTPERTVQAKYYRAGVALFREMREIIAENNDSPAGSLAMIDLYRADWDLLFNQERAESAYQEVFAALSAIGANVDEVNRLFSQPQMLPIPIFYDSINRALAATEASEYSLQNTAQAPTGKPMQFQEWFYSMPFVPFPVTSPTLTQSITTESTDNLLQFRLNSLDKVSRWVSGTYQTRISVIETFDILNTADSQVSNLGHLSQRLHLLHFRPRMEDGLARPFEGTLLYRTALE